MNNTHINGVHHMYPMHIKTIQCAYTIQTKTEQHINDVHHMYPLHIKTIQCASTIKLFYKTKQQKVVNWNMGKNEHMHKGTH